MDETVRRLGNPGFYVTALVARWRAPTSTLTWVNCGHPPAYLVDDDGALTALDSPERPPLGTGRKKRVHRLTERQFQPGERLIVTDGITSRKVEGGGTFGVEGLQRAIEQADSPTASSTALAIQQAVTDCGASRWRTTQPSSRWRSLKRARKPLGRAEVGHARWPGIDHG